MGLDRPLSALELTALGVILKRGECVAHAVVREFAGSQTFAYCSGAGSIYPLLKRLAAAGLVACSGRLYSLTEAGIAALRTWVRPPFDESDFATNLDEFRSRAYFLALLDREEIDAFVVAGIAGLRVLLDHCLETLAAQRTSGDRFGELAMLGAVRETEARIGWLNELRERLSGPEPADPR